MNRRGIKLMDEPLDYEKKEHKLDEGEWAPVKLDWHIIWLYVLTGLLAACVVALIA